MNSSNTIEAPRYAHRGSYHKPAHQTFIRHMQRHGDATLAYRAAYPKAKKESARVGGIRLFALPHVRHAVEPALRQMQQQAREQAHAAAAQRHALEQEEYYAMRVFLARIVRGEIPKRRVIRFATRYIIVEETLSPFLTLRAIELDSKLEAWERVTPLFRRQFLRIMQQARKLHHSHLLPTSPLPPLLLAGAREIAALSSKGELHVIPPLKGEVPKEQGDVRNTIVQNTQFSVTFSAANAGGARDAGDSIKVHQSHHPHHSSDKLPAPPHAGLPTSPLPPLLLAGAREIAALSSKGELHVIPPLKGEVPKEQGDVRNTIVQNTQFPVTFSAANAVGTRDAGDSIKVHQSHHPHHSSDKLPVPPHAGLPTSPLPPLLLAGARQIAALSSKGELHVIPPLKGEVPKEQGDVRNTIVQNTQLSVTFSAANAGGTRDAGDSIKVHQNHHPHHSSDDPPLSENDHSLDETHCSPVDYYSRK